MTPWTRRAASTGATRLVVARAPLATACALLSTACAGAPPPAPPPIVADRPSLGHGPSADGDGWEDGRAERPPVSELPAIAAPRPPHALPWIAPSLTLDPPAPVEGSVVAVRLRRALGARRPLELRGALDGRPLHFRATPEGWLALGALPVDRPGSLPLTLSVRAGPDSVVEWTMPIEVRARRWPATRLRIGSRTRSPDPEVAARLARERESIGTTLETVTPAWLAVDGFDWPRLDRITSPFGQRRLYDGQVRSRHFGLDIAGRTGAPVQAAAAGRVALTGDFVLQGRAVYVDHGLGVYSAYFHLSRLTVRQGDRVERGELLGRVGATGRVTGPHLHWSLYVGGEPVDPSSILALELPEPLESAAEEAGASAEAPEREADPGDDEEARATSAS